MYTRTDKQKRTHKLEVKKHISNIHFLQQKPNKKKTNYHANYRNFCLTHTKPIPVLSSISQQILFEIFSFSANFFLIFANNLFMADNYIENLLENYPNFLLAIDRIIRLEPRRINQHKNPQQIISIRSISIRSISKKKKQNAITTKKKKKPKPIKLLPPTL